MFETFGSDNTPWFSPEEVVGLLSKNKDEINQIIATHKESVETWIDDLLDEALDRRAVIDKEHRKVKIAELRIKMKKIGPYVFILVIGGGITEFARLLLL